MAKIKGWLISPGYRFIIGFLTILVCGPLSIVFPPVIALVFLGAFFILFCLQTEKHFWTDGKSIHCPICQQQTQAKLVRVKIYAFPLLPFIGRFLTVPIYSKYYLVCGKCLKTHLDTPDFSAIKTIAQGDMAHVTELTHQQYMDLRQ